MLKFQSTYFLWALGLLGLEVGIGLYLHDALIRPYGGDFLIVILLYCLARSVVQAPVGRVAAAVLLLACAVEASQYAGLLCWLGWQNSHLAHLVLGSHFAWGDLLAYALGAGCVLGAEQVRKLSLGGK
ncbi:MAG: DUF2809 domain-containing protein [Hymenobacter sp.]|nr:MAG: DUF2809 domain-containing protein [Hymenobacter sp.]